MIIVQGILFVCLMIWTYLTYVVLDIAIKERWHFYPTNPKRIQNCVVCFSAVAVWLAMAGTLLLTF
jgi:hypothetical protein